MLRIFRNLVRVISFPRQLKLFYSTASSCNNFNSNNSHIISQLKSRSYNSKFNESRPAEILDFLKVHRMEYKERDTGYSIKYCPFCPKPHNDKADNLYKLGVHKTSGCFFCFRCNSKGSWYDFKKHLSSDSESRLSSDDTVGISSLSEVNGATSTDGIGISSDAMKLKLASEKHQALLQSKYPEAIAYLTGKDYTKGQRGLKLETLIHYKIGLGIEKFRNEANEYSTYESMYFPMYNQKEAQEANPNEAEDVKAARNLLETPQHAIERWKIRAIGKQNKHRQRVDPAGKIWYCYN